MLEINTKRLTLKKMRISDKNRLIDLIGDYRVSKTLCGVPHPYNDADADYWLNCVKANEFKLSIFQNSVLIGGISLDAERDDSYCEFGYWLGFEYWGKGYATEASNAFLNYIRTNTSHKHIKATVHKGNNVSSKVLLKVGFKKISDEKVKYSHNKQNIPILTYELTANNNR